MQISSLFLTIIKKNLEVYTTYINVKSSYLKNKSYCPNSFNDQIRIIYKQSMIAAQMAVVERSSRNRDSRNPHPGTHILSTVSLWMRLCFLWTHRNQQESQLVQRHPSVPHSNSQPACPNQSDFMFYCSCEKNLKYLLSF